MADPVKSCSRCRESKPLSAFGQYNSRAARRAGIVKKVHYSACHNCRSFARLKYNFPRKYGITWEQYLEMYEAQGGLCFLCDAEGSQHHDYDDDRPRLLVDHNHSTDEIRKLLCGTCNTAIGYLETRGPEWLKKAQIYIDGI